MPALPPKADNSCGQRDVRFVPRADMHSIRLPCVYYFFLAVVVIGYETTTTACWTLLFIVRTFFNNTITVAVWAGFCAPHVGSFLHL
jgi:hypothetical protein